MTTNRLLALFIVATCLLWLPLAARADTPPQPIVLWPGGVPGEKGDPNDGIELPLKPNDTTIRITNVTNPTINVFPAPAEKNTGAAVVICPGGGYNILAYNKEGTEVAEWLNSIGVTGIVLKYRVPAHKGQSKHAAPLADVQRALGIVRHRASQWQIKPDRIGVLGFSAGGHLASTLSTNYGKRAYDSIDAVDQVSCRPDFALLIYPAYLALAEQGNKLAPELNVSEDTPPTFLMQTQDDGVRVECSVFYYLALKKAEVPVEMHLYPHGGHGYGLRPSSQTVSSWPQRAEQWMRSLGVLDSPGLGQDSTSRP